MVATIELRDFRPEDSPAVHRWFNDSRVTADLVGSRQTFTEDCTVCCRPNLITLGIDDEGDVSIEVTQEYEA